MVTPIALLLNGGEIMNEDTIHLSQYQKVETILDMLSALGMMGSRDGILE